ncbi:hypothetical protein GJ496_006338 [Pomphorhynchus laevis]|nr:hypothetical protein GJ496_006338 [Pomphorhynchus laevis]
MMKKYCCGSKSTSINVDSSNTESINISGKSNTLMMFKCLPNPFCTRNVNIMDRRHGNLYAVPEEIFKHHKTLEELFLDSNQLRELPKNLFKLSQLRLLTISDNEIEFLSPDISNLVLLEQLDCSRNELICLPDEIRFCESLQILNISGNPLQNGLPAGVTGLLNLQHLTLNDCSLTHLPEDIGSLTNLQTIEVRENLLRVLPESICQLSSLLSIDLGSNELCQLPRNLKSLSSLKDLWLDLNELEYLPSEIGDLHNLQCLDVSYNRLSVLPETIGQLHSLTNLELSSNCIREIPDKLHELKCLNLIKLNSNQLSYLPESIGGCTSLIELIVNDNLLRNLPNSIGCLKYLTNLNADKNLLSKLPESIIGCERLGIMSLRYNRLKQISPMLSKLQHLKVLDLTGNFLNNLPRSFLNSSLKAIWLSENQAQPILRFQEDIDDQTGLEVLTCFLLPQQQYSVPSCVLVPKTSMAIANEDDDQHVIPRSGVVKFVVDDTRKTDDNNGDNSYTHRQSASTPKDLRSWKKRLPINRNSFDFESGLVRDLMRRSIGSLPETSELSSFTAAANMSLQPNEEKVNFPEIDSLDEITNTEFSELNIFAADCIDDDSRNSDKFERKKLTISKTKQDKSFGFTLTCRCNVFRNEVFITNVAPNLRDKLMVGDEVVELDGLMSSQSVIEITIRRESDRIIKPCIQSKDTANVLEQFGNSTYPIIEINICKESDDAPLGLSIVGGVEQPCFPFDEQCRGIFIFKVHANGVADKAGIKVGDRILMANGEDISNATHNTAVTKLTQRSKVLSLLIRRDTCPRDLQEIVIDRGVPGLPLGMKLNGGLNGKRVNRENLNDTGIFITEIVNGGIADVDGRLKVGMRLLAVIV